MTAPVYNGKKQLGQSSSVIIFVIQILPPVILHPAKTEDLGRNLEASSGQNSKTWMEMDGNGA